MNEMTRIAKDALKDINGFIGNNNYNVIKVEEGYCELEGIISETSYNNMNIVHGGYIFGLADTAAGIAALSSVFGSDVNIVTVDASINYFKPAKGEKLIAKAKTIKPGKTISVIEVEIYNDKNDMVAKTSMTFYYITK
ncbi:MAG: PaaI family thioesterase [Bacilli bacterium]|nr:PaaI family thioesterase [Bacilli bacterium]